MDLVQLITTVDSKESALQLARAAVQERMAACVQIVGPITSVYRWMGAIEETTEFLLVMKTPTAGLERLTSFVRDRHPYDTPELRRRALSGLGPRGHDPGNRPLRIAGRPVALAD